MIPAKYLIICEIVVESHDFFHSAVIDNLIMTTSFLLSILMQDSKLFNCGSFPPRDTFLPFLLVYHAIKWISVQISPFDHLATSKPLIANPQPVYIY